MTVPAALYRNAIDLNRYSNKVAKDIIVVYNDIIVDAANQLQNLLPDAGGEGRLTISSPVKAARLRAILAQLRDSLNTWSGGSITALSTELQGLAELQTEFATEQLRKALPAGQRTIVNTVEVSPQFAASVVTTDPTQIGVITLSDDLYAAVQGAPQTYSLTATQGTMITLPNGEVVSKAFRGIAVDQAEQFSQVVRNGLLTGETTPAIAKRLIGRLQFGDYGPLSTGQVRAAGISVKQLAAAGGELTAVANNQVMALVRTSINQVANAASQQVYEANQDITKKYRYIATLDTRTSARCRALDGREFEYGKGPMPPQHFNCRSTTVPILDYNQLGKDLGIENLEPPPSGKRAASGGMVPSDTTYGEWLKKQPRSVQNDAIGADKVPYFNRLADKYGAKDAMAKLVRDDGSELSLDDLRKRYGAIKER
jgi:SPP1 gp7 family putative phage head morphogenesis protein